jgi:nucleoside 2-deoxyribosyltransferase
MSNWDESEEWERFASYQREHTVKAMEESAYVMSLVPGRDKVDVKFAVELGLAIMLDKPIIAMVQPGVNVPPGLRKVATAVIVADLDTEKGKEHATRMLKLAMKDLDG